MAGGHSQREHRVALIDDHDIVAQGFARVCATWDGVTVVATVASVDALEALGVEVDLVILDLRLADRSLPADNVARLRARGANVLAFTGDSDASLVRSAAHGGVLGVVRKSEPVEVLREAVMRALEGEPTASFEWASAIDADPQLADAGLSAREREALSLYAAGAKTAAVADQMGVSSATVIDYIRRVRSKYVRAGRPARTKVDLYQRAVEDGLLESPLGTPGES
ncbi:MAG TPA: response regulator [Microbacteriaceae bacterium]|nr:response regulator [Microbacteriaceae bacterium]